MKKGILALVTLLFASTLLPFPVSAQKSRTPDYKQYGKIIREKIYSTYRDYCRESGGHLPFPFIVPGGAQYGNVLWDWDSWLSDIAIHQAAADQGGKALQEIADYEKGCVLNFLRYSGIDGWVPVNISMDAGTQKPENIYKENMHKPCLAQHAAFIVKQNGGDAEWLRDEFFRLEYFVGGYVNRYRHRATGLYFWQNDVMIGVDNDPCTYFRPDRSSGSIFLNCMMYKELRAMEYLAGCLNRQELAAEYARNAEELKAAVQEHCWDERDGFFYSVDLNLRPVSTEKEMYHGGAPRTWDCLIQRIGVWSGFLAMWADIATPEQAERMVREHFANEKTFNAPYGVRTLSKMEKMYSLKASGNPSTWLGPIWGVSNYLTWRGLVKYGFEPEARELASKTIALFGRDYERTGVLHEYYQPSNGEPILNPGFQNWNTLVINMLNWMDGKAVVTEF